MATPEITPNIVTPANTAEEIKAAWEASQAIPATPAEPTPAATLAPSAPPAPEWGQMAKNADGTYQVTLATGEVFKGTADEVISKQAEAHVHTKRWGQDWKQKFEGAQPVVQPQAETPPAPQPATLLSPEEQGVIDWQDGLEAKRRGQTIEQYRQEKQVLEQSYRQAALQGEINAFKAHVKYVETPDNEAAMIAAARSLFPEDMKRDFLTSRQLYLAYCVAKTEGKIQEMVPTSSIRTPIPPVMPSSGGGQVPEENLMTMPLERLRERAMEVIKNGQ